MKEKENAEHKVINVNKKRMITVIVSLALVVGGIAMIAVGALMFRDSGFLEFVGQLFSAISGNVDGNATASFQSVLKNLIPAFGLIIGGIFLIMIGAGVYRSYSKKERKERQTKAEAQALLAEMQWQQPPAPLVGGGPASLESASAPTSNAAPMQKEGKWFCSECGHEIQEGYNVCPFCATHLLWQGAKRCPQCGSELKEGMTFCPYCGIALEPSEASDGESASPQAPATQAQSAPKAEKRCFYCGATIKADEEECPECHHKFVKQSINPNNINPNNLQ